MERVKYFFLIGKVRFCDICKLVGFLISILPNELFGGIKGLSTSKCKKK